MTPGYADHGGDIGRAADGLLGAEDRRHALDAVDAVLQGDDAGVGADQRPRQFGGLFGVPQLDREQHDVDRADVFGIVGDVRLRQVQVAVHALDLEAVLLDGFEMGAARDEEHIVAGRRHAGAEITADRARRHCRYSHARTPKKPLVPAKAEI